MKTGSDCGGQCTWYFDTVSQDLVIKPNPGATGNLTVSNTYGHSYGKTYIGTEIKNVTIAEGITGLNPIAVNSWANPIGYGSTLTLPTSLTQIASQGGIDLYFSTLIMPTENLQTIKSLSLRRINNLVLTPSEGKTLPANFFGRRLNDTINYGINIICNGDINLCKQMVAAAKAQEERNGITFSYEQRDSNGNTLATYDSNGNLLTSYAYHDDGSVSTYDASGKLIALQGKKIFSVDEATALVSGNGKNKFTIKYR